jgi:hypothetical protein
MTSNPSGNYVTGESTNRLTDVALGAGEEWEKGQTPQNYTLKEVLDMLRDVFQCYWYIDADGDFRIEHKMYFEKMWDDSTSITTSTYSDDEPETDALLLQYDKSLMFSHEEFTQAQNTDDTDFLGLPITYDVFETLGQVKKYNLSLTTDIGHMASDDGSKSGMVLYHSVYTDADSNKIGYIVLYTDGVLSSVSKLNAYFSWANLHDNFWSWGRMSENANINGSDTTADSTEPFLIQDNVRFHYSSAIDGFTKMVSSVGNGRIKSMLRDLETDFITFTLLFDPYE